MAEVDTVNILFPSSKCRVSLTQLNSKVARQYGPEKKASARFRAGSVQRGTRRKLGKFDNLKPLPLSLGVQFPTSKLGFPPDNGFGYCKLYLCTTP